MYAGLILLYECIEMKNENVPNFQIHITNIMYSEQ